MGGNVRAINRSTGEEFLQAKKIDLNKFKRSEITENFKKMFIRLNVLFFNKYSESIWENTSIIQDGFVFNGSSEAFFNKNILDEAFTTFKPFVGDIDITVPREKLHKIFTLLTELESSQITENIQYVGQNKKDISALGKKEQINSIFYYQNESEKTPIQVDFEAVNYVDNKPDEWAKFGHSAAWEDIQLGYKGVNHKYLLINAFRAISKMPNIILATPKAKILENVPIRTKKQRPGDIPRMYAFSVTNGVREKLERQYYENGEPAFENNLPVYKEKPTSQSEYIQKIDSIFELLFNKVPNDENLKQMKSFVGVTKLMEANFTDREVEDTFEYLVMLNLFGPVAQPLEVNNPDLDFKTKWPMAEHLINTFHCLKGKESEIIKMAEEYKNNYKYRGLKENRIPTFANFIKS
jgi:hypothetical protein